MSETFEGFGLVLIITFIFGAALLFSINDVKKVNYFLPEYNITCTYCVLEENGLNCKECNNNLTYYGVKVVETLVVK